MINIVKRDGSRVPFDIEKLYTVIERACEGLNNVFLSEIIEQSKIQFVDGMTSSRIQEIVTLAAANLISAETPDYQYVAARLKSYDLRKMVYGQYKPPALIDIFKRNIELGVYDPEFLDLYTEEEFDHLQTVIQHKRDKSFTWAAMGQLTQKYLLRNRGKDNEEENASRVYYETPQVMYMAIAMALFSSWDKETRLKMVEDFYNYASTFKFSLPTPIMSGVRTKTRQFSSCVVIRANDSLDSICASGTGIVQYVSKRAGIGFDLSRIRAIGSSIRNGEMEHTGTIPFIKKWVGDLKSCSQGGVRGGSATFYFPMYHYQYPDMIVLKNNKGKENNRERRADYGVQANLVMIERLMDNQDIYLFDPKDCSEEFKESFFNDNDVFRACYESMIQKAERGEIRHKKMPASEIWQMFIDERSDTGRIYLAFVDNMNMYSPFTGDDTIYSSNLCMEIALPNKTFEQIDDEKGRIALCTLASFNLTAFETPEEMAPVAFTLVSALDMLLGYQDYPMIQAREGVLDHRSLGIGTVNVAHFLAKNFTDYGSPKALSLLDHWMAHLHYYLVDASCELAKKFGPCRKQTKQSMGILTPDIAPLPLDLIPDGMKPVGNNYGLDWDGLKERLRQHGIRNATLLAIAPTESSSQVLNATNGIEPPKGLVSMKVSKDGSYRQVVPESDLFGPIYKFKWDIPCRDYLKTAAVMQRWVDQAISTNTYYDPEQYPDNKIPRSVIMQDILDFYSWGGKTLYYQTNKDQKEKEDSESVSDPNICDTCVV